MFTYTLQLLDYSYNNLKYIRDSETGLALTNNNILTEYNNGYRELQFTVPYKLLVKTVEQTNPLISLIVPETIVKYSDSNSITEYFLIKQKKDIHDQSTLDVTYMGIPIYVNYLSKLGVSKTVGGEDVAPQTCYEWALDILEETGWTVNIHEELTEDISVRDSNGALINVHQIKRRAINLSNSNCYNMIQELRTIFNCHITFDSINKQINIYESNSVDHDGIISYGKNLDGIERLSDSDKVITKLYAYGGEHPTTGLVNISSVNPTLESYILNFDYYIALGYFTATHSALLATYNTKLTNLNLTLLDVQNKKVLLDEEHIDLTASVYTYDALVNQLLTDISSKTASLAQYATTSADYISISAEIVSLTAEKNTKQGLLNTAEARLIIVDEQIALYENMITSILSNKSAIYLEMNQQLGQFIKEGLFQDQSYMYAENLYSDALEISERVSYPEVTYKITMVYLQGCTGYELEQIRAGDNLKMNDSELGITALPIQISKIDYNLDNLLESPVEVSTVISTFEDTYSKIMKSTTIISSKSDSYNRAASAFNSDGTLKTETLEAALAAKQYNTWLNSIGTIQTTTEGLYIYSPILINGVLQADTSEALKIISGGIYSYTPTNCNYIIKSDGTINANYLTAGIIDVTKVIIRLGTDPCFSFNKNGLIAYDYSGTNIVSFVNYAKFYKNGLELYQNNNLRLIAGRMSDGYYGFAIYDDVGDIVVRTSDEGDFWLQKYISVGGLTPAGNLAGISGVGALATSIRFWAGASYADMDFATFKVTDDGSLYAYAAYISGEVHASIGSIDQYLYVGNSPNRIIIDSGLDEYGDYTRTCRIYTDNWNINSDGSATFNNITARGTIGASIFAYDETSVTSGNLMIMSASKLDADLIFTDIVTDVIITLDGEDTILYGLFKINDILSIQYIDANNLRVDYWFKVTAEKAIDGTGDITVLPIKVTALGELPVDGLFPAGSIVINWKQGATSTGIRLVGSSLTESAPFIDLFSATQNGDLTYTIPVLPNLRIGNLAGITDADFLDMDGNPIVISGYGLYADNVFLKGIIVAENAIITNSSISGSVIAGTIDTGNVYLRDRAVSGSPSEDGWYFVIYPDDINDVPDKTMYRFLSYETGVFIRNYNWYFFHDDGLDIDESTATGAIFPSDDLLLFSRIGSYFVSSTDYISGQLVYNTLQFTTKTYAGVPNITNYDISQSPIFEIGLVPNNYGFVGAKDGTDVIFGVSKVVDNISQLDGTKTLHVGINTDEPIHDVQAKNTIGADDGFFWVSNGSDSLKAIKHYDSTLDSFCIDFYVLT